MKQQPKDGVKRGRPKQKLQCPYCPGVFGSWEMQRHLPKCARENGSKGLVVQAVASKPVAPPKREERPRFEFDPEKPLEWSSKE